jgi:hypothetical protein
MQVDIKVRCGTCKLEAWVIEPSNFVCVRCMHREKCQVPAFPVSTDKIKHSKTAVKMTPVILEQLKQSRPYFGNDSSTSIIYHSDGDIFITDINQVYMANNELILELELDSVLEKINSRVNLNVGTNSNFVDISLSDKVKIFYLPTGIMVDKEEHNNILYEGPATIMFKLSVITELVKRYLKITPIQIGTKATPDVQTKPYVIYDTPFESRDS